MEKPIINMRDTIGLLLETYLKVVFVNITNNTFEEVKVSDDELDNNKGYSTKLSEWFKGFAFTGNIHSDDLTKFLQFTDLDNLNKEFASGKEFVSLRYRRMQANEYHWVRLIFRKSFNYTNDNRILLAYIEDINDDVLLANQILTQNQITDRLVDIYFTCLYVDLNNYSYTRVHVDKNYEEYVSEKGDMNDIVRIFENKLVVPKDLKDLEEKFSVDIIKEMLLKKDSYDYEYEAKLFNGKSIWCRLSAILINKNEDGSPNHILIAMQDVTEQVASIAHTNEMLKEAFSSAVAANSAKSDFLSRMSHDIRTPLNGIIGMTAIAGTHISEQERVADSLSKIASASKHLLSLINEILDLSKIESGKIKLNEAEFSLKDLIDETLTMTNASINQHKHTLNVYINNVVHENVIGDNVRLQQVFMNILSNAIKYTKDGGTINISLSELPTNSPNIGEYRFVCEDNGYGMSKDFLKKLFEPFERSNDKRTYATQGTGLGMAIVKNIVNMMGGDIEVESEENVGSKFTIDFKMKYVDDKEISSEQLIDLPVLVVDDDLITCESTCITLKELGMKSEYTTSGLKAVDMVIDAHNNKDDYYACLIDWKMNDIDGFETTRRIRKAVGPEVPIIIISAYDWNDIEGEALKAGADAFISKPLFKSRLKAAFIDLPKNTKNKTEEELATYEEKDYSNKRLLLVEDNDLNREIAEEILKMTKAGVESAVNGKEALEKFANSPVNYYDMIFMDVRMPVMDGYEATRAIRSLNREDAKGVPIVALSANAFVEDIAESKKAGMNEHMAKPIDFKELLKVMEACLENK